MDVAILTWLNSFAGDIKLLDGIMIFLSKWVMYLFVIVLIIGLLKRTLRTYSLIGIVAIIVGVVVKNLITLIYYRPRPFIEHDIFLLIDKEPSASFPSITTLIAFVVATSLWLMNRKVGGTFYIIALLIGISRIYVGHHYPSDVLVGGGIGIIITFICLKVSERFLMKKTSGGEGWSG